MKSKLLVLSLIGYFTTAILAVFLVFAWFDASNNYQSDLIGSSKLHYFEKGTGTQLDPFYITKSEHLFNLTRLQEEGLLSSKVYYFKVADPTTDLPITIDFSDASSTPYQYFKPIGDHNYPFIGYFEGNQSTIKNITIDGSTKQDIGVFGFIGENATVRNFFLDSPTIYSNPTSSMPTTNFHSHNDGNINRATGYIAGHLSTTAILEKVYVISPTIDSTGNAMPNRSQYGLIGYAAADGGNIDGGPRDSYFFSLTADWAYDVFEVARANYLSYYINSGSLQLPTAIPSSTSLTGKTQTTNATTNYTLSTLKISPTINDINAPYLYDKMIQDGHSVSQQGSVYSRENIDIVGGVNITGVEGSRAFSFSKTFDNYPAPSTIVGQTFQASAFPGAILLYVRPTADPLNLGTVTGTYAGGGGTLAYVPGIVSNAYRTTIKSTDLISFAGGASTMIASNAYAKLYNNNGVYTVAPANSTNFDYYVFALTNTNSNSTAILSVAFEYSPANLNDSDLDSIKDVDFINTQNDVLLANPYVNSYLNFGYDLISTQRLWIKVNRRIASNDGFEVYIDFLITDQSIFYLDFINITNKPILIYYDNSLIHSGTQKIITLRMNADETVTINTFG